MPLSNSLKYRLQFQHETIAELAAGLSEDELKHRINPEKWSAFENIVHLVAYQPTFIQRVHAITKGDNPVFERYQADNDPHFHNCLEKSMPVLMADLNNERQVLYNLITGFNSDLLNTIGTHKKYGSFTLSKWTEFFLLHESHHLFTIFMLTSELHVLQKS